MLAGKSVQRGLLAEHRNELLGVHRRDLVRVELAAQPLLQERGALERPLHRDLLIEEHADEQRERIGVEQAVGVGVAGDREGSLHDQSLRLHHGSSCLVSVSG